MCILCLCSPRRGDAVCLVFFGLFQLHYLNRAFVYPLLLKGRSTMPLGIVLMGVTFNVLNALMQGGWIFLHSSEGYYTPQWLLSPQFIVGTLIFFRRNGRQHPLRPDHPPPAQAGRPQPLPAARRHVPLRTSANYFGEIVEWIGFAVLTWSAAGAVFAIWTFANLVPRADAIYKRYNELFGEQLRTQRRKRIIPYIY